MYIFIFAPPPGKFPAGAPDRKTFFRQVEQPFRKSYEAQNESKVDAKGQGMEDWNESLS